MTDDSGRAPRRRPLPLFVFVVLLCSAVATSAVLDRVVHDQEQRLLKERASEASALLSTSFSSVTSTLPLIGALATASPQSFEMVANGYAAASKGWIATVAAAGDSVVVRSSAGEGAAAGSQLNGNRAELVKSALGAKGLVANAFGESGQRRLGFAVTSAVDRGVVVYEEFPFEPAVLRSGTGTPFSELEGAVYSSATADPNRLVLATTNKLPISGEVARKTVDVGASKWLLVVKTKRPLVGSLAMNSRWYVLGVGLVTALLVAALVELVSRRRVYALALVEERTSELRAALAEKEVLEQGQRQAREAAEEANRSKSEFLSRMSHELRTPLNAVLGFAQLLESEDLRESDHDSVKQILRGGRHLLDLINEVLDITRIETGTFQLSPEPVLASEVLAEIAELSSPLAAQANVNLVPGTTPGSCDSHVLADHQRLKQILLNLVSNGIKYNRPGGTVALSCERMGATLMRIKVHDTGPGIRPEHRELLFTPFERLGAEQTSVEGTGIGLALSRRLAEAMGGTLDVETALGQGSTFWLELPIVEAPLDRYTRLHGDDDVPDLAPEGPTKRILYIEDNASNLQLVERILSRAGGVDLVSATHGRLGLELARQHQPALILLDLHLPDITGDEVLRQLRDDPQTAGIPVVIVSADATEGQVRRLLAEGARAYLTKPLDVGELRGLVASLPEREA
jgi:signal transduction histidine kinase/ActR/RegA family two-component response regulator